MAKATPSHTVDRHGMGAELVVQPQMAAFAEQMQIEIGQHRREAIGVLELDGFLAEPRAQTIVLSAIARSAGKQSGIVDALKADLVAAVVDDAHRGSIRHEHPHHRLVILDVPPEIAERVGMAPLDDGIGFGRELSHHVMPCSEGSCSGIACSD